MALYMALYLAVRRLAQDHPHLVSLGDNVIVRHDISAGVDDEARASGALILLARAEGIVIAEEREACASFSNGATPTGRPF